MNYYLFTTDLRRGGAQRVVSILARQWAHDALVTIIILRNEVHFDLPSTVRVISLDCATDAVHFYSGIMVWQARRKLKKILKQEKEPFILYSFLESPNFISVLLKSEFPGSIFIGGIHVNIFMYSRIFHLLYPCYGRLDALIACSQGGQRLFIEKFGVSAEKVFFIPNPIDFADMERQIAEGMPVMLSELVGKRRVILAAGRLEKVKNFTLLLRAFALLPTADAAPHLIIIGDGPERKKLLKLAGELGISGRLTMPGKVANPYVWMAHSDLFVLSSNFEGWPMVLVEAMACGLPVVACNCQTGPGEILQDGTFGLLVPTNDVEALSAAMARQLHNEKSEYPFLRKWGADIIARSYRNIAEEILKLRKS